MQDHHSSPLVATQMCLIAYGTNRISGMALRALSIPSARQQTMTGKDVIKQEFQPKS